LPLALALNWSVYVHYSDYASSSNLGLDDPRLFREACYVGGQCVQSASGATLRVDNPATGEILGTVPKLSAAETRQAIEAAHRAFPTWSRQPAKDRAAALRRWFDLVLAHQEDLARLMTLEQGKPLAESRGEVAYAAAFLEWFGEEAKRVYATPFPPSNPTSASSSSSSPSASLPASLPGISPST
jgi:succinate-semialdehyde dehydrogenase/glutarate-semialdehyde dehydrogenase